MLLARRLGIFWGREAVGKDWAQWNMSVGKTYGQTKLILLFANEVKGGLGQYAFWKQKIPTTAKQRHFIAGRITIDELGRLPIPAFLVQQLEIIKKKGHAQWHGLVYNFALKGGDFHFSVYLSGRHIANRCHTARAQVWTEFTFYINSLIARNLDLAFETSLRPRRRPLFGPLISE